MRNGLVVGSLLAMLAGVTVAAQFDMAAAAKWQNAKVVHYQVVGVFKGSTPLSAEGYAAADVTDRVTVDFDMDVKANAILGKPTFTNTPTQVANPSSVGGKCPPPTINGTYEHFDLIEIVPGNDNMSLKAVRSYPAGAISSQWPASCTQRPVAASKEDVSETIVLTSPLILAMPTGDNPKIAIAADRKSFSLNFGDWKWTYTPTIVK